MCVDLMLFYRNMIIDLQTLYRKGDKLHFLNKIKMFINEHTSNSY
jgi:hypothetical protein